MSQLGQLNRRRAPTDTTRRLAAPKFGAGPELGLAATSPDTAAGSVDCLPDGEEIRTEWGHHWLRREPIVRLCPPAAPWLDSWPRGVPENRGASADGELSSLVTRFPAQTLFLDLETCGFAGSMVFLIGAIHQHQGQLVLSQLLARHYGEERAMLATFWRLAAGMQALVTFNGKSFDWPMLLDRTTLHRLESNSDRGAAGLVHCDLLHHARRRWKRKLPDCKLQTLERWVCGRRRHHDIAGREIPEAYHDFVRTGDGWLLRSVLHHNALDLVTLLQLSRLLVARIVAPSDAGSAA